MAYEKINQPIVDAVDILIDKKLQEAGYDKTVSATIVQCISPLTGKHLIQRTEGQKEVAYSQNGIIYNAGDQVYITIPSNDSTMDKQILGMQRHEATFAAKSQLSLDKRFNKVNTYIFENSENNNEWILNKDIEIPDDRTILQNASFILRFNLEIKPVGKYNPDALKDINYSFALQDEDENNLPLDTLSIDEIKGNPYYTNEPVEQVKVFNNPELAKCKKIKIIGDGIDNLTFTIDSMEFIVAQDLLDPEIEDYWTIHKEDCSIEEKIYSVEEYKSLTEAVKKEYYEIKAIYENDIIIAYKGIRIIEGNTHEKHWIQYYDKGKQITDTVFCYWAMKNPNVTVEDKLRYSSYTEEGWELKQRTTASIDGSEDYFLVEKGQLPYYNNEFKCVIVEVANQVGKYPFVVNNLNRAEDGYEVNFTDVEKVLEKPIKENEIAKGIFYKVTASLTPSIDKNLHYEWKIQKSNGEVLKEIIDYTIYNGNEVYINEKSMSLSMIFTCSVSLENEIEDSTILDYFFLADKTYIWINEELTEGYHLVVENRDQTFSYNGERVGAAPKPLSVQLFYTNKDGETKKIEKDWTLQVSIEGNPSDVNETFLRKHESLKEIDIEVRKNEKGEIILDDLSTYYIDFSVANTYSPNASYNQLRLSATYDNVSNLGSTLTSFAFLQLGDPGTNGTQYVCQITEKIGEEYNPLSFIQVFDYGVFSNEDNLYHYPIHGKQLGVKVTDVTNGDVIIPVFVKWEILHDNNINEDNLPAKDGNEKGVWCISITDNGILQTQGTDLENTEPIYSGAEKACSIVRATIELDNGLICYAYIPLVSMRAEPLPNQGEYNAMVPSSDITCYYKIADTSGLSYIVYSSNGKNPRYIRAPFKIYKVNMEDGKETEFTDFECAISQVGSFGWGYINIVPSANKNQDVNKNYLTIKDNTFLTVDNKYTITPNQKIYDNSTYYNTIEFIMPVKEEENQQKQALVALFPILLLKNRYEYASINGWDGQGVDIGDDYVLSPMAGFGKKNDDNSFTGVVLGEGSNGDLGLMAYNGRENYGTYTDIYKETHLLVEEKKVGTNYNYYDSNGKFIISVPESSRKPLIGGRTVYIDANTGVAYFGAEGRGQIVIDGTNATITGGNFETSSDEADKIKVETEDGTFYSQYSKSGTKIDLTRGNIISQNFAIIEGNAFFRGEISGSSGIFGKVTINNSGISHKDGVFLLGETSKIGGWEFGSDYLKATKNDLFSVYKPSKSDGSDKYRNDEGEIVEFNDIDYPSDRTEIQEVSIYLKNSPYYYHSSHVTGNSTDGYYFRPDDVLTIAVTDNNNITTWPFVLLRDGSLTATRAYISGDSRIGGWKINADGSLYSDLDNINSGFFANDSIISFAVGYQENNKETGNIVFLKDGTIKSNILNSNYINTDYAKIKYIDGEVSLGDSSRFALLSRNFETDADNYILQGMGVSFNENFIDYTGSSWTKTIYITVARDDNDSRRINLSASEMLPDTCHFFAHVTSYTGQGYDLPVTMEKGIATKSYKGNDFPWYIQVISKVKLDYTAGPQADKDSIPFSFTIEDDTINKMQAIVVAGADLIPYRIDYPSSRCKTPFYYNLGAPSYRWHTLYVDDIYVKGNIYHWGPISNMSGSIWPTKSS